MVLAHTLRKDPRLLSRIDADVRVTRLVAPHPQEYVIPIPQFDLSEHALRRYSGEWRVGRRRRWLGLSYPIAAATWLPRRNGTVVRIRRGFRRNEIPELIALLSVVYAEAWPEPDATSSLGGGGRGDREDSGRRLRRRGRRSPFGGLPRRFS